LLSDRLTHHHFDVFGTSADKSNLLICFSGLSSVKPFQCLASKTVPSFDFLEKTQCLPLYLYDKNGHRLDIFSYVYAVLHHPAYLEKYAINLKREFPRIPFYEDFQKWETWGRQLMTIMW